jgi:hypothetical protein
MITKRIFLAVLWFVFLLSLNLVSAGELIEETLEFNLDLDGGDGLWEEYDCFSIDDYTCLNPEYELDWLWTDVNEIEAWYDLEDGPSYSDLLNIEVHYEYMATNGYGYAACFTPLIRVGTDGFVYNGDTVCPTVDDSFEIKSDLFTVNPVTGEDWTLDDLNNLQIGIRSNLDTSALGIQEIALRGVYVTTEYNVVTSERIYPDANGVHGYYWNDRGCTTYLRWQCLGDDPLRRTAVWQLTNPFIGAILTVSVEDIVEYEFADGSEREIKDVTLYFDVITNAEPETVCIVPATLDQSSGVYHSSRYNICIPEEKKFNLVQYTLETDLHTYTDWTVDGVQELEIGFDVDPLDGDFIAVRTMFAEVNYL